MPLRPLRVAVVIVILGLLGAQARGQTEALPVVISPVVEQEINTGQSFVGTIIPTRRATVGSAVDGRVIEFPIEIGDRVEANQPLAQILTNTVSLELKSAQAELELRRQELRELENGARPEEIAQAAAQLKSAQASSEYQRARLARTLTLRERGGVTEQALDEIQSLATAAEQKLLEAEANYSLVEAGPREEQIAQARAQVAMQQAVVDRFQDQLEKHTIKTRFTGYVVAENTEAGAWVAQGDPIAEIIALDSVDVEAHVPENAISYVRVGADVRVEISALPDRLFTGTVVAINPQADVRTRTFPVLVRIKNEIVEGVPTLKSGMIARVVLPTGPQRKSTLVPKDALVLGRADPVVFVVADATKGATTSVRPVPVRLGLADGPLIEAIGDVRPGQHVVVLGNENLRASDRVRINKTITFGGSEVLSTTSNTKANQE